MMTMVEKGVSRVVMIGGVESGIEGSFRDGDNDVEGSGDEERKVMKVMRRSERERERG